MGITILLKLLFLIPGDDFMNVNLIGVPLFLGSDIRGVNFGPEKLREKDIINVIKKNGHNIYDLGNLYVKEIDEEEKYSSHEKMKYINPIVEVNTNLAHQVYSSMSLGNFPFVVGGDHSLGLGSISGSSKVYSNLAVVWIDAHGDINTHETTPSGNVHGMPLAAAMGIGHPSLVNLYYDGIKLQPQNAYIIGARDLDEGEIELIEKLKLNLWTTTYIKEKGLPQVLDEVHLRLKENNVKDIHVSFDIDCLDKALVPGTGTPVTEGLYVKEAKEIIKFLMESDMVRSMDFVELNTLLDVDDVTADIAVDLIDWTFKHLKLKMSNIKH
jgi:arginase